MKWSNFQNSGAAAKGGKREKAKDKKGDETKGAKDKIEEQVCTTALRIYLTYSSGSKSELRNPNTISIQNVLKF